MSALAQVQLECDHVGPSNVCRDRTSPLYGHNLTQVRAHWRARGWGRGGTPGDGSLGDLCPRHAQPAVGH